MVKVTRRARVRWLANGKNLGVPQHNKYASAFLSEGVPHWHSDIIKGDKCSSRGSRIAGFDLACLDTFPSLYENDGKSILRGVSFCVLYTNFNATNLSLAAHSEVVSKRPVRNPFLRSCSKVKPGRYACILGNTIDDPFLAVLTLNSSRMQTHDVASSLGL